MTQNKKDKNEEEYVELLNGTKIKVAKGYSKEQMKMLLGIPEETEYIKEFKQLREFFLSGKY